MVLVTVVPILAPITIGIALSRLMVPAATIATVKEVVVELLCMIAVVRIPIKKPTNGFEVAKIICFTISSLSCPNALLIKLSDKKKAIKITPSLIMRISLLLTFMICPVCLTIANFM